MKIGHLIHWKRPEGEGRVGEKESSGSDPNSGGCVQKRWACPRPVKKRGIRNYQCFLPRKTQKGFPLEEQAGRHERSSLLFAILNEAFEINEITTLEQAMKQ